MGCSWSPRVWEQGPPGLSAAFGPDPDSPSHTSSRCLFSGSVPLPHSTHPGAAPSFEMPQGGGRLHPTSALVELGGRVSTAHKVKLPSPHCPSASLVTSGPPHPQVSHPRALGHSGLTQGQDARN